MLPSIHIRWPEDSDDTDRPRTNASRSLTITFKEVETIFCSGGQTEHEIMTVKVYEDFKH